MRRPKLSLVQVNLPCRLCPRSCYNIPMSRLQFKIIIIFNKFGKVIIFKIIHLIALEIYDHINSLKIMKPTLCIQGTLIHSNLNSKRLNFTVHTNLNFYTSSLQLHTVLADYEQTDLSYLYESESSFSFLLATNLCKLEESCLLILPIQGVL